MKIKELTKKQGIILTGFTGMMLCKMDDFHKDVEKRLGRPIFTHEFGDRMLKLRIKETYRKDFESLFPKTRRTD